MGLTTNHCACISGAVVLAECLQTGAFQEWFGSVRRSGIQIAWEHGEIPMLAANIDRLLLKGEGADGRGGTGGCWVFTKEMEEAKAF